MNKDLHKYSDAELLSFYRRTRKPDYLIGLYERYMPLVYGVTLKYLKNVPDAQDADLGRAVRKSIASRHTGI